jgi:HEPN domain-containing protein
MTPIALNHPDLKQAAQELERRVGDYTRMRYPRPVFYPRTPSDLYSEDDARETIRLAEIIVRKATTLLTLK